MLNEWSPHGSAAGTPGPPGTLALPPHTEQLHGKAAAASSHLHRERMGWGGPSALWCCGSAPSLGQRITAAGCLQLRTFLGRVHGRSMTSWQGQGKIKEQGKSRGTSQIPGISFAPTNPSPERRFGLISDLTVPPVGRTALIWSPQIGLSNSRKP